MNTIPKLLMHQVQTRSNSPALRIKRLGIWETITWSEAANQVKRFAGGLLDLNVSPGEVIVIIGNNTPDIYCAMTACQVAGAIAAPVYAVPAQDSFAHVMKTTGARIAVVQDQQQVDALIGLKELSVPLSAIIYTNGRGIDASYDSTVVQSYDSVCRQGDSYIANHPSALKDKVDAQTEDDVALIMFNSGIDEVSKPAQLSHKNLLSCGEYLVEQESITEADELLSFMPISLAPNLLCGYIMSHIAGFCVNCPESTETVMEDLHEITPSIMYAPPYAYKQITASMHERMESAHGLSRWLYEKYLLRPASKGLDSRSWLAEILIRAPIRNIYGLGRLRLGFTGGDSIHVATFNLLKSLGVELKQLYGTVETSGCITAQVQERSADNVGHPIKDVEVRVSEDNEVLCKGKNVFCGYYQDKEATQAVIDADGWYHTGDVGEINPDETLRVYDKLTACGKLNDGKVYFPKIAENAIKASPYVKEAFVSDAQGDGLFAVICVDPVTVGRWAENHDIRYTSYADLSSNAEICKLIAAAVAEVNQQMRDAGHSQVNAFSLMQRVFSPSTGELTWTNKLHRTFLKKYFSVLADAVSQGKTDVELIDATNDQSMKLRIAKC